MISFNETPNDLRIPFVSAEFDSSNSSQGPSLLKYRALIIGQKIASGTMAANTTERVTSVEKVAELAGRGSILHRMSIAWFASNQSTDLTIAALDDDSSGAAATGSITVTLSSQKAGTIAMYLGSKRIPVGVTAASTQDSLASAIAAKINADNDLPVTATASTNVVTVLYRNKGEVGNKYDIRDSRNYTESLPQGVSLSYSGMSGGSGNPSLSSLIAALGDEWFHIICHPYTDAASLSAIELELESRIGPLRSIDGLAITSSAGSFSDLATLGSSRNSKSSCIASQAGSSPLTQACEHAAETAAIVARYGSVDPARPFQTLVYRHTVSPTGLFTATERNLLLFDGISTNRVSADRPQIERMITTYRKNSAGGDDTAYLDATTMLILMYLRYSWRTRMQAKYPRHKLADDGVRVSPGQFIMTPKLGKAEAVGWFREMEGKGLVEGFEQFKKDLVVSRNTTDPNRLDLLLSPDLINQLIFVAARVAFRL